VMETIVCGVDSSPGARAAARVAAKHAEAIGARLIAVHVLDRVADVGQTAERVAADVLYDEVPDARAEARGEVGGVAERLAAVARAAPGASSIVRSRSRASPRWTQRARSSRARRGGGSSSSPATAVRSWWSSGRAGGGSAAASPTP
jgi:nucleotide-binding universal stress UspA family protein